LHEAQFRFYDTVTESLTDAELSAMPAAIEKCAQNVVKAMNQEKG